MADLEIVAKLDQVVKDLVSLSGQTNPASRDGSEHTNGQVIPTKDSSVTEMWQMHQWLQEEKLEYQGALNAVKSKDPPSSTDPEQLQISVTDLQQKLLETATDTSLRNLILQRLQLSHQLLQTLFPPGGIQNATPEQEQTRMTIVELLEKQANLSTHILRIIKEMEAINPELVETAKNNLELLKRNRELMWQLEQAQKDIQSNRRGSQRLKEAQEQFDQERSRVDLVRHIFQGLILGSGIDWAANQDTADLMVGLGMPLETQLH